MVGLHGSEQCYLARWDPRRNNDLSTSHRANLPLLFQHPQLTVQGGIGKSQSSPTTASSSAVLLMLLAQVTVLGSDHTGLFPQRILIPQLFLIRQLIRQLSERKDIMHQLTRLHFNLKLSTSRNG